MALERSTRCHRCRGQGPYPQQNQYRRGPKQTTILTQLFNHIMGLQRFRFNTNSVLAEVDENQVTHGCLLSCYYPTYKPNARCVPHPLLRAGPRSATDQNTTETNRQQKQQQQQHSRNNKEGSTNSNNAPAASANSKNQQHQQRSSTRATTEKQQLRQGSKKKQTT